MRRVPPVTCLAIFGAVCLSGAADAAIEYDTEFAGVDDSLKAQLTAASQLVALEEKQPEVLAGLRRRAGDDLGRLKSVMDSQGYYDAALTFAIDQKSGESSYTVTVTITPGAQYRLDHVAITVGQNTPPPDIGGLPPEAIGLTIDGPAIAAPVVAADGKIVLAYKTHGFPYAQIAKRDVIVDSATKTMDVTYRLDPGAMAHFGLPMIAGLDWLQPDYVQRRIAWQSGALYDQRQVDNTQQTLVTSGLFSTVAVTPAASVGPDGTVPMNLNLVERPLHTLGVGGSYDTTLGIEANLNWEDRDLFGQAEDLLVSAKGGQSDSGLNIKFTRPDMFWYRNDLVASVSVTNELEEAFRALHEEVDLGFQTHLDPTLTAGYGIRAEHARVDEKTDYRVYTLVSLPVYLRKDASNDLLNPTEGYRAGIEFTPYIRGLGSDLTFLQTLVKGSTYRKLDDAGIYILAVQGILGASFGTSLDSIPKDHRFYAGGGGSVRGFGYQKAGPLDQYDNPIGGRSLTVASVELRTRIMDNIQLVPFFEVGTDSSRPTPSFSGSYYYGAGLGVRYLTPIGPLRFDIAVPVNPRPQGDSPIQAYISLGQAF